MNILDILRQLRDDIKTWVINNLNALNAKIDEKTIPIDSELSSTSTNPVQNRAITKAINNIPTFSGDYNDLINAPDISEDESGDITITDEMGNIIFKVDATGTHTTSLTLNGQTIEELIDAKVADNPDSPGGILSETDPTVPAWAKEPTKPTYTAEEVGALPDTTPLFSGDYNDLKNAPNITEDESNNLVIADPKGNIIFRSDADGFETTKLTAEEVVINGVNIGEAINELGCNCDLSNYQTKDDNNLATTDKTIVGAINEINNKIGAANHSEGLAYTLSDDESYYTLSGIGTCTDTDIIIPSTYNGKPVTTISNWAFYRCSGLTSVVIGDSVTTISGGAFYECINLTSVVIPDSVTTIGMSAFYACTKLIDGYYKGTAEQWALITIDTGNNSLLNATIHYNYADSFIKINNKIDNMAASGNNGLPSCPTEDGNYILRVTNGVPTWVPVLNAEEATF